MNREAQQLYRSIKRYRLDWRYPKKLRAILKKIERGRLQSYQARTWLRRIRPWVEEQEKCFNPFPPAPSQEELGQFDIEVGELIENPGVRVGVRILDGPRHMLVTGGTGSGKSNILRRIVNGLDSLIREQGKRISVLIFDFKGDFVDVQQRLGRDLWDHYSTEDGFRIGCAAPSDCLGERSWINRFTKVIAAHCDLKYGESCLASVMGIAFDVLNRSLKRPLRWMSLGLIDRLAKVLPTKLIARKPQYQESVVQQTGHLLRNSGSLFDASRGFDVIEHLIKPGRCAVVDCTKLSPKEACIVVNLVASQLLFSRISRRLTVDTTEFVLIVDEADPICCDESSECYPEGYSPLGQLVKQGREFGILMCLGVGSLDNCSRFITSNVTYHFILNQNDPASAVEAARTLMEPDSRQLVSSLERGTFIYKEAMGPVRYGILAKADYVEPARIPRPDKFDQHSFIPAKKLEELPELQEAVSRLRQKYNIAVLRQSKKGELNKGKDNARQLSKKARTFLSYASMHEYEPATVLFRRMEGVSGKTQIRILKELEDLRLIESATFRSGNSKIRLVQITEQGWGFLKDKPSSRPLRGGIVHSHISRWIQAVGRQRGYEESVCEWQIPGSGGFADVAFKINGKWQCLEVVVDCVSNIVEHAKSCFVESSAVVSLTIVTTQKKDEWDKVMDRIMSCPSLLPFLSRISLETVDTYYKELFS